MNDYRKFSYYFDDIMYQINYNDWLEFTKQFIKKKDKILDLACGSGTLVTLLSLLDYNIDGLDLSKYMIEVAKEKARMNHINPDYYVADMTSFKLDTKYDVITCYFDSINHLPNYNMVKATLDRVYEHLKDGGLFIFDVFSKYAYLNCEEFKSEDVLSCSYDWHITRKEPNILEHKITIYDNLESINEIYYEYYYPLDKLIDDPRFNLRFISGDFLNYYDDESGRLLIVLEKKRM